MYLKKLFIVAIITCTVAYITGLLMDTIYKKRWFTLWFQKTGELIQGNKNYDIIFLGNSRVHFGINPFYVDSVTKLSSYNFGNGGADAEEILLTSTIYLQKHLASTLVIISLDPGMLTENEILKTRFHYLFYLENDTIKKYMTQAGFNTNFIKYIPFAKYCFFDEYNRTSIFVKGKPLPEFDHNIYKGFLNIHQTNNNNLPSIYNVNNTSNKLSETAIRYFAKTISLLQQKGSIVVFVSPPLRSTARNIHTAFSKKTDSIFSNIANEYHIKQIHFENDTLYKDEYFVDDIHFNEPGTRIYSRNLGDSINRILNTARRSFK